MNFGSNEQNRKKKLANLRNFKIPFPSPQKWKILGKCAKIRLSFSSTDNILFSHFCLSLALFSCYIDIKINFHLLVYFHIAKVKMLTHQ